MALMFPRLARNFIKDGYFPTDEATTERLLSMLEPADHGTLRIVDPCAGEGVALAECKHHFGAERTEAYGVEFDAERAGHAKTLLDRVIHGDYQDTLISPKSFGLLWLNPPYGDLVSDRAATGDAESRGRKRLEKLFYQRGVRLLQPGGVLVLIIPHYTLDKELSGWIAQQFERVVAYRAATDTYKQVAVVGIRRSGSSHEPTHDLRTRLEQVYRGEATEALPELWPGEPYFVPGINDAGAQFRFHTVRLDPRQLHEEIARYPCLWPQFDLHFGRCGRSHRRPLRNLTRWHLALSLAAGQVSGVVQSNDGRRTYVVKGDTFKQKKVSTTFEETDAGAIREIRTATDVFVPVIRALDFTPDSPTYGDALVIQ